MPTIVSHSIVAMAIAPCFGVKRISLPLAAVGAFCAMAPDLDVIGLRLGIPYESMLGHRGFSHSLLFALLLGVAAAMAYRRFDPSTPAKVAVSFLFLCTASHGFFDAFTNGGLGVAFFSPFIEQRYFFPWQPIQVSPLSLSRFISGQAWPVLASELLWVILPSLAVATAARFARRTQT